MSYLVKHRMRKGEGQFWYPGDILTDEQVPKPRVLSELGWIQKIDGDGAVHEPAPPPDREPEGDIVFADAPSKKKRGRPKKNTGNE